MTCNYPPHGQCGFAVHHSRPILHQSSTKIWGRRLWLVPENDLCLRKESLVTQLKANVMLVIASPNVNHLCRVARAGSRDEVICGIEDSLPLHLFLSFFSCTLSILSVIFLASYLKFWVLCPSLIVFAGFIPNLCQSPILNNNHFSARNLFFFYLLTACLFNLSVSYFKIENSHFCFFLLFFLLLKIYFVGFHWTRGQKRKTADFYLTTSNHLANRLPSWVWHVFKDETFALSLMSSRYGRKTSFDLYFLFGQILHFWCLGNYAENWKSLYLLWYFPYLYCELAATLANSANTWNEWVGMQSWPQWRTSLHYIYSVVMSLSFISMSWI